MIVGSCSEPEPPLPCGPWGQGQLALAASAWKGGGAGYRVASTASSFPTPHRKSTHRRQFVQPGLLVQQVATAERLPRTRLPSSMPNPGRRDAARADCTHDVVSCRRQIISDRNCVCKNCGLSCLPRLPCACRLLIRGRPEDLRPLDPRTFVPPIESTSNSVHNIEQYRFHRVVGST